MSTMGLKVTGQVLGAAEVRAKFARAGLKVHDEIRKSVQQLGLELLAHVKADKLSGQVLNVRTGRLRRSINMRLDDQTNSVYAYVGTNVEYARILEQGGTTAPHEIVAKRAQTLAFAIGGTMVFRKRVNHPGSKIAPHSFLQSALNDMRPDVAARIETAVLRAVKEA